MSTTTRGFKFDIGSVIGIGFEIFFLASSISGGITTRQKEKSINMDVK